MSLPKVTPWLVVFILTLGTPGTLSGEHSAPAPKHLLSILELVKQVCFTRLCYYMCWNILWVMTESMAYHMCVIASYVGLPEGYSLCFGSRRDPVK